MNNSTSETFTINTSTSDSDIELIVDKVFDDVLAISNYYASYCRDGYWKIKYYVSNNDKYNVFAVKIVTDKLVQDLRFDKKIAHNKDCIISFLQLPLPLMLEKDKPLIFTIAKRSSSQWKGLEFDDAISICYLVLVRLYNNGYYINKDLLKKSYSLEVAKTMKKEKDRPTIVSLDEVITTNNSKLTFVEFLIDDKAEEEVYEVERTQEIQQMFDKIKRIIVGMIGERGFDKLYKDYANKTTDKWSVRQMYSIKRKLKKMKITKDSLL